MYVCRRVTLFVPLAISVVELTSSLRLTGLDFGKLFKVLYYGFLYLLKFQLTVVFMYVFKKKLTPNCTTVQLCIPNGIVSSFQESGIQKTDKANSFLLLFVCAVALFLLYFIFLPIVAVLLPSLHQTEFLEIYLDSGNTYLVRLYLFSTQVFASGGGILPTFFDYMSFNTKSNR